MTRRSPATITGIALESAASRCGLRVGDKLLAINELSLRDIIDVRIFSAEPFLELLFERAGQRQSVEVDRRYSEPLGLEFAQDLFDDEPRVCRNRCEFCFVAQMAPGMRAPLYVKDDDYRLSFLHGNYITLTNLDPSDWDRIEEQYLSPLYVSVHATEPNVRLDLMRNPRSAKILDDLHRLADISIELHTQAVLVPGRNDGAHLDQTIADLVALHPAVQNLTVVPVGLTRWHSPDLRVYTDEEAGVVLEQLLRWQERLRSELGVGFVYPSDEWFLRAGVVPPELPAYDGQLPALIENGIGMVRCFLDGAAELQDALAPLGRHQTWVTGMLFAPQLTAFARTFSRATGIRADVLPVANRFFGETVTVAGLLTVDDIVNTLTGRDVGDAIVIPEAVFRGPEGQSLDGAAPETIQTTTGCPVYLASQAVSGTWTVAPLSG